MIPQAIDTSQVKNPWPDTASAIMEVDLGAVRRNYRTLKSHVPSAKCAAVLKADAYGFGMIPVAKALRDEGCQHFFVAHVAEGLALRPHVGDAHVYILSGVFHGTESQFIQHNLTPILNDVTALQHWMSFDHPCVIHVDTGMLRCGLSPQDFKDLTLHPRTEMIMSHLACSPDSNHEKNQKQLALFQQLTQNIPLKKSLADTGGIYLDSQYHKNLVRPGKGLFGLFNAPHGPTLENCVTLKARIIQYRDGKKGESVGYGATTQLEKNSCLATVALGYADGLDRRMSGKNCFFMNGTSLPIVGSLSMDYTVVDVSHVPENLRQDYVELLGAHQTFEDMAKDAGTISRELSIRLGSRLHKIYIE